ncbi:MAG: sigma-70 family RNA polymerase sigma factor [Planctomycetia bacterium]|nr:sigma-70 family RNA polymerase sigma factor [Planctomycetia bacterium]
MTNLETRESTRTAEEPLPADAELLTRWCVAADTTALEELIHRHGAMVFGVCRRALGNTADAEDAFQATFLIFVRKAHTLDRPAEVAAWLHAVALRVARKARAARTRRYEREVAIVDIADPTTPEPSEDARDLRQSLDEELDRLPEKYRLPIVLCELEGRTLEETAQLLGWPKGTVAGRLSRGRELLRRRLSRRGLLGCPLFLLGVVPMVELELPPEQLVSATLATATGESGTASQAVALANAVLWRRGRLGIVALLLLGSALAAIGWYTRSAAAEPVREPVTEPPVTPIVQPTDPPASGCCGRGKT